MSGENKLMTVSEAAKYMDKSEVTIKRWARERLLQSVKQGSDYMFEEEALKKYMEIEKRLS